MTDDKPSTAGRALALAAGGAFLSFLDVTITNLAIPDLARDFPGSGVTDLSWVVTLYTILFAALLAPAGRLADLLGSRTVFAAGTATFTLFSLLAALAPSLELLLVARALQGLGAAAMIPASLAFVLTETSPARRAAAIGIWSAAAAGASAVGPALGGVLVDGLGWRSLFLINVPLGAVLVAGALRGPRGAGDGRGLPDFIGAALLALGVGLLVVGVTEGEPWGWGDPRTLVALGAGAVAIAAAIARSARSPIPAIEVGLWRNRTYATANVVSALFGAALYAWMLLGVLFLTQIWGYSELEAGLAMTHGAFAAAAVGISIGRISRPPSPRTLVVAGGIALGLTGLALAAWLPAEPSFLAIWLPAGLVGGAGMGAISVGVSSAAALSVEPQRFAGATGLNVAARQVGGALGVAALAALLAAGAGDGIDPFRTVYLLCALAALAAGAAGVGLAARAASDVAEASPRRVATAASER